MTSLCLCRERPGEIVGRKPFDRLNNVFLERLKILSCEYLERLPRPTNPTRHVDWVFWNLITKFSLHFVDQQFIFWTQIDFLDQTPFELTNDFRSRKKSGYWRVHRGMANGRGLQDVSESKARGFVRRDWVPGDVIGSSTGFADFVACIMMYKVQGIMSTVRYFLIRYTVGLLYGCCSSKNATDVVACGASSGFIFQVHLMRI